MFNLLALRQRLGGYVTNTGRQWYGPGPGHSCRDRSLSVTVTDEGRVLVHSFAGDDFRACVRHLSLERPERNPWPAPVAQKYDQAPNPDAVQIWRSARPNGEVVQSYLRGRAITLPVPPTLRQSTDLIFNSTPLPTMVAALQMPDGRVGAVQRLRLTWAGRKAPGSMPRISTGSMYAGSVRLAAAAEAMGIAEGIETALSAQQLFEAPVWATLGSERLSKVWLPPIVTDLTIFADADEAGQKAAAKAGRAFSDRGLTVRIRTPLNDDDWNDCLAAKARKT
jgi:putative DNA primase/helicase